MKAETYETTGQEEHGPHHLEKRFGPNVNLKWNLFNYNYDASTQSASDKKKNYL